MLQNSIAVIKHYDYNLSALADSISLTNEEIISYRKSRPRYPPYHANECMICHKQLGHRGVKKMHFSFVTTIRVETSRNKDI